jgi:uncharacterized protein
MYLKSLKNLALQNEPVQLTVEVTDRLPYYIYGPCTLSCTLKVRKEPNYYSIEFRNSGDLRINCQRCLQDFTYHYEHHSELALCATEEIANRMMTSMDCTVQSGDDLDIQAILTDDLHLFCPEKHADCTLSCMKDLES